MSDTPDFVVVVVVVVTDSITPTSIDFLRMQNFVAIINKFIIQNIHTINICKFIWQNIHITNINRLTEYQ